MIGKPSGVKRRARDLGFGRRNKGQRRLLPITTDSGMGRGPSFVLPLVLAPMFHDELLDVVNLWNILKEHQQLNTQRVNLLTSSERYAGVQDFHVFGWRELNFVGGLCVCVGVNDIRFIELVSRLILGLEKEGPFRIELHPGSLQNHDTFFTFLSRICQRSRLLDLFVFLHNVAENSFESVQDVIVGVLSHRDCGIMNWNFLLHELDHLGMP
jgi:hypothetical protein